MSPRADRMAAIDAALELARAGYLRPEPEMASGPTAASALPARVPPAAILAAVTREFWVTDGEVLRGGRLQNTAIARLAVYWLLRQLTDLSWSEIGRFVGGRDHSTAMHGCRSFERKRAEKPQLRAQTDRLLRELEAGAA